MTTVAKLLGPIVINTARDLTPKGKRAARVVKTDRGIQLRWYVGGKIYSRMPMTAANVVRSSSWIAARKQPL